MAMAVAMAAAAASSEAVPPAETPFSSDSPYLLLLRALSLIPVSHFLLSLLFLAVVLLYNFLEAHFFHDLLTGFRGDPVSLTCDFGSDLYCSVTSKCRILHGRYLATPWLCSPHLQTAFVSFFGRAPKFTYRRQLFHTSDGGTIALDWLLYYDVRNSATHLDEGIRLHDKTPILIVIPGLTSDSDASYIKHLAFTMAKSGWNVVVSNHRGLGGISITSDCFYNAGWTKDIKAVVNYLHQHYQEASIFVVGTSIGANVLVKYLGEEGESVPIVGAAAICSPWDLLICDRFINRKLVQKLYDKVLTSGLQGYAKLHETVLSRLANWDGIEKSRSVREFDHHATRILGKYETVDTFYRRCGSASFVGNVAVPLLCISALDDPVCTREAIPWDECRANKNIILAATSHGGHLGHFEGITASSLWWVRAVDEFLGILLHSSPHIRRKGEMKAPSASVVESSIDQGPYVNVSEDGMIAAVVNEPTHCALEHRANEEDEVQTDCPLDDKAKEDNHVPLPPPPSKRCVDGVMIPVERWIARFSKQGRVSILLLTYIAITTTWPLIGPAIIRAVKVE